MNLEDLPPKVALAMALECREIRTARRKFYTYYPDTGPLRRDLYQKHLAFFRFGETHQIRGFMSANRVGKTEGGGGYEMTAHLTGHYPKWWEGAKFTERVRAWAAGDTRQTTKEIIQQKLMGDWGKFGTGLIPGDDILKWTPMPGVPEAVGTVWVQHHDIETGAKDGISRLVFKSFDQGREAFQGTEQEVIWLDEESDEHVRGECILRQMTTDGILMETFTPLKGLTPVVMTYLPNGYEEGMTEAVTDNRALVMAGWNDVPHLTEDQKANMLAETMPHLIDARSKGIPSIGSGAVYPLAESEFVVDDIPIPANWPRAFAMDVGWKRTAALWGAKNPDTGITYLYAEYYRGQAEPPIHAMGIKARGEWIPGVIDPAAMGGGQDDGKQLAVQYKGLGLDLDLADNTVESGLHEVWTGLSTGTIKVFKSLQHWRTEYRMYHRDEKGRLVKDNDHLMDCSRYLVMSGMKRAKINRVEKEALFEYRGVLDPVIGF